ncbi:MAG: hypothetical protein ACLFPX_05995 [Candidatus Omnitrophota bacterium]
MNKYEHGCWLIGSLLMVGGAVCVSAEIFDFYLVPNFIFDYVSIVAISPTCSYFDSIFMIILMLSGLNLAWMTCIFIMGLGIIYLKEIARRLFILFVSIYILIDSFYMVATIILSRGSTSYGTINIFQIGIPILYILYLSRPCVKKLFK